MGLSSGATVLIGQAWGAGEPGKVRAVAGATLTVALLCATTIAVFGGVFSRPLLIALATPPDILEEAIAYAHHDDHHAADLCLHSADGDVAWCRRHHDAAAGAGNLDNRRSCAVILSRAIGIEGVWAAYPITFTGMFILQMSYYMLVW